MSSTVIIKNILIIAISNTRPSIGMGDQLYNVLSRVQGAVYKAHHQHKNNIPPDRHPQELRESPEAKQPMLSNLLEALVAPKTPLSEVQTSTTRSHFKTPGM